MPAGCFEAIRATGAVLLVGVFGGLLCGGSIGVVPVYLAIEAGASDCGAYASPGVCPAQRCHWLTRSGTTGNATAGGTEGRCAFLDETDYAVTCATRGSANKTACAAQASCTWRRSDGDASCVHKHGLNAVATGVFAGGLIFGAIVGSALAGPLIRRLGAYTVACALAVTIAVGTAVTMIGVVASAHVVASSDGPSYPLLVLGRVVVGVGMGLAHVACPLIPNQAARPEHRGTVSAVFQASFQAGIAIPATIGVGLAPDTPNHSTYTATLVAPTCALLAIPFAAAVALFVCSAGSGRLVPRRRVAGDNDDAGDDADAEGAALSKDIARRRTANDADSAAGSMSHGHAALASSSPTAGYRSHDNSGGAADGAVVNADVSGDGGADDTSGSTSGGGGPPTTMRRAMLVASCLACAQQLTGINSVITYAPKIAKSALGVGGLAGSCVLVWWNLVWTLASVVLAPRFPVRTMYLGALAVVGGALVVAGVVTLPAVSGSTPSPSASPHGHADDGTTEAGWARAIAGVALAAYIAAFQLGMGAMFWTLAAEIFAAVPAPAVPDWCRPCCGGGGGDSTKRSEASSGLRRSISPADDDDGADSSGTDDKDSAKALGSSFTNTVQLTVAMALVVVYPPMVQGLGGGAKGLAIVLLLFAGVAAVTFAALFRILRVKADLRRA